MKQQQTFTVAIGDDRFTVSKKVADVSQYFHNILSLGIDEEDIQIDPQIIDRQVFQQFLKFCQINEYQEPIVGKKIKTNNVQQVLDPKNFEFIKEYKLQSPKLIKLINASLFLVCSGLKKVIAAVYACKIYFQDSKQAFLQKKKQLGIPENVDITFEQQQKFREQYYVTSEITQIINK